MIACRGLCMCLCLLIIRTIFYRLYVLPKCLSSLLPRRSAPRASLMCRLRNANALPNIFSMPPPLSPRPPVQIKSNPEHPPIFFCCYQFSFDQQTNETVYVVKYIKHKNTQRIHISLSVYLPLSVCLFASLSLSVSLSLFGWWS